MAGYANGAFHALSENASVLPNGQVEPICCVQPSENVDSCGRACPWERKMAKFDQRGQEVEYQFNADVINLSNVSNRAEFAHEIENISSEIERASALDAVDATRAKQVQRALKDASVEAQKLEPNKSALISFLEDAGNLVKDATALGGLYLAIAKAIELARQLF
jgi:hypothetical protein